MPEVFTQQKDGQGKSCVSAASGGWWWGRQGRERRLSCLAASRRIHMPPPFTQTHRHTHWSCRDCQTLCHLVLVPARLHLHQPVSLPTPSSQSRSYLAHRLRACCCVRGIEDKGKVTTTTCPAAFATRHITLSMSALYRQPRRHPSHPLCLPSLPSLTPITPTQQQQQWPNQAEAAA